MANTNIYDPGFISDMDLNALLHPVLVPYSDTEDYTDRPSEDEGNYSEGRAMLDLPLQGPTNDWDDGPYIHDGETSADPFIHGNDSSTEEKDSEGETVSMFVHRYCMDAQEGRWETPLRQHQQDAEPQAIRDKVTIVRQLLQDVEKERQWVEKSLIWITSLDRRTNYTEDSPITQMHFDTDQHTLALRDIAFHRNELMWHGEMEAEDTECWCYGDFDSDPTGRTIADIGNKLMRLTNLLGPQ